MENSSTNVLNDLMWSLENGLSTIRDDVQLLEVEVIRLREDMKKMDDKIKSFMKVIEMLCVERKFDVVMDDLNDVHSSNANQKDGLDDGSLYY